MQQTEVASRLGVVGHHDRELATQTKRQFIRDDLALA